jgi:hypothetical protein
MGLSRSRTFYFIILLALVVYSLRPEARVDAFVDVLFAPAQGLRVLVAPLRWIHGGEVRAALDDAEHSAPAEIEASRALLLAEQSSARPKDRSLSVDRGFVLAEVIDKVPKRPDEVVIAFNPEAVLARGMPVVCGDVYVGRVKSVDPGTPGRAQVALVTGSAFRVGARVEAEGEGAARSADLVVGGLVNRRIAGGEGVHLAAQFSSDRSIESGVVRVFERDALEAEPYRKLANGYLLGTLKPSAVPEVKQPSIEALLEYEGGLTEVAVLSPDAAISGDLLVRDPFDARAWIETSLVLDGNPSAWRVGSKIAAGSARGLSERAALALGPRLVGRVTNVGVWTSEAILLGDPGFQVNVLARIDGLAAPLALGRLTSLGFDPQTGDVLLRANGKLPRPKSEDGRALAATLFTGSGDLGVPPGLWIGTTEIPVEASANRLAVRAPQAGRGLARLAVWSNASPVSSGSSRP